MKVFTVVPSKFRKRLKRKRDDESDGEDDLFQIIYKCGRCFAGFRSRRQLRTHKRRAHTNGLRFLEWARTSGKGFTSAGTTVKETSTTRSSDGSHLRSHIATPAVEIEKVVPSSWPLKRCVVSMKKLQFVDIEVTTPKEGFREISYTLKADTSRRNITHPDQFPSQGNAESFAEYIEYRKTTIKALPPKLKPRELPAVPTKPLPLISKESFSLSSGSNKRLRLKLPAEFSFVYNVNGLKDDVHSIVDLITGHKIRNGILDSYLARMVACYNSNEINEGVQVQKLCPATKFHCLPSSFLPVYTKHQPASTYHPNRQFLPEAPLDDDSVLIAPLFACYHFYLAVFNCFTKSVHVYDSSWHFMPHDLRKDQVLKILVSVFPDCSHRWTINFEFNCAQQIDNFSCGCYVIYFAENLLKSESHRNKRNLSKEELSQMRTEIVTDLLPTSKTGSLLLEAITE